MKFIIYGAGKRGKELLDALGAENVVAFADFDNTKCGTEYCGLPVVGVEELYMISAIATCVVTPVNGRKNIVEELKNSGIINTIPIKAFDDVLRYGKDYIFDHFINKYSGYNIAIYGMSAGAIVLYEYLIERMQKQVYWVAEEKSEIMESLCNEGISASDFYKICQDVDIVINTEFDLPEQLKRFLPKKIRIIGLQEILEEGCPIYNKQIEVFRNIHCGKRCFIVATGPSLLVHDLDILCENGEKCISMNRVYNLFAQTAWRPDYYMIEDAMMIEDLGREIADMNLPVKFVSSMPAEYWKQREVKNSIKYKLINLDMTGGEPPLFSENIEKCVYEGSTVTYACIQLAVYMGFSDIYLLGVDFNYSQDLYDERNHFAGYQKDKKIRLNKVYPERMLAAYESAKQYAKEHGIRIYNATRGGKLEVFERVNFDALF